MASSPVAIADRHHPARQQPAPAQRADAHAVTRNPPTMASVVSSMWKAAASRVCPPTCISQERPQPLERDEASEAVAVMGA